MEPPRARFPAVSADCVPEVPEVPAGPRTLAAWRESRDERTAPSRPWRGREGLVPSPAANPRLRR